LPKIDPCQTGTDSKLVTLSDTMLREDIGEELSLASNEYYFYGILCLLEKIFDFLIFEDFF
jgi:hypothetical protein